MAQNRAKFGYLAYNDMLQKITDGVLDQHDVVFTKDTKETFIQGNNIITKNEKTLNKWYKNEFGKKIEL